MAVEKNIGANNERAGAKQEIHREHLEALANAQKDHLRDKLEQDGKESSRDVDQHKALTEAQELANETKERPVITPQSPAERRRGPITKQRREQSFRGHIKDAQQDMTSGERLFSKLIHTAPIEKVSDIASSTIARPNALLCGSIAAFFTITILYFTAKHYGFQLSGFEAIAAFVGGWLLGILYDYFSVMIRGKKH